MIKTESGNFERLSPSKQHKIICAALAVFSDFGFEKASAEEITYSAGISKGLLFHYFGSKKGLFDFTIAFAQETVENAFSKVQPQSRDYFDLMTAYLSMRLHIAQDYPMVFDFCRRFSLEIPPIPEEAMQQADTSGFKFRTNIRRVNEICLAVADAQIASAPACADAEEELIRKLQMLKDGFYREGF